MNQFSRDLIHLKEKNRPRIAVKLGSRVGFMGSRESVWCRVIH